MLRVCALFVSMLLLATPAWAAVTTKFSLTNSGWTDLGAGPLLLSFQGPGVFAIGDTTPTLVNEGFGIRAGRSFPVKTTSHVWAAATGAFNAAAYAAPISGGGTGGGSSSVWSSSDATAGNMTLTNAGLTVAGSPVGTWKSIRNTTSKSSGKLYIEFLNTVTMTSGNVVFGLASSGFNSSGIISSSTYSGGVAFNSGGTLVSAGFTAGSYTAITTIPAANDVVALAVDFTTGHAWLARNNSWILNNDPTGPQILNFVPATVGALFVGLSLDESGTRLRDRLGAQPTPTDAQPRGAGSGTWTIQPTASSQKYAPPAGFSAWDGP